MGWMDLLQTGDEKIILPWIGGRSIRLAERAWRLEGRQPEEYGWYSFQTDGRKCAVFGDAASNAEQLVHRVAGYLVGDRLIIDGVRCFTDPRKIINCSEQVHLIEPGLDRFVRILAGRTHEGGPLIYAGPDMMMGVEQDVDNAFLNREVIRGIKGVTPALEAAFNLEIFHREEAERRRLELLRLAREEEAKRQLEERRRKLQAQLGDGASRREMAAVDFDEAAKAALAIGGAVLLDARPARTRFEMVVKFRLNRRKFECTCDKRTLRIIDSGICLTDHDTGEKGDTLFTLESLPSVIMEAERDRKLVVYRHVE